jgi:hypothetical protein
MVDLKQIPVITNQPIGRRGIRDVGGPVLKLLGILLGGHRLFHSLGIVAVRYQTPWPVLFGNLRSPLLEVAP